MSELGKLPWQFDFTADFTVPPPHSMMDFSRHSISGLEVLVAPSLISTQVFFRPVVPKNLNGTLCLDGEILLAHMAPYHIRVLERVSGPDIKDLVHPILEKNSSRMGTPCLRTTLVLVDLEVLTP